ncbi:MAG: hypothetical protein KKH83_05825 [Candidatus Margulisbacteria bacterium]|nr:hypothetical protein [Candidatus Margulisiibacteriota bacterium]
MGITINSQVIRSVNQYRRHGLCLSMFGCFERMFGTLDPQARRAVRSAFLSLHNDRLHDAASLALDFLVNLDKHKVFTPKTWYSPETLAKELVEITRLLSQRNEQLSPEEHYKAAAELFEEILNKNIERFERQESALQSRLDGHLLRQLHIYHSEAENVLPADINDPVLDHRRIMIDGLPADLRKAFELVPHSEFNSFVNAYTALDKLSLPGREEILRWIIEKPKRASNIAKQTILLSKLLKEESGDPIIGIKDKYPIRQSGTILAFRTVSRNGVFPFTDRFVRLLKQLAERKCRMEFHFVGREVDQELLDAISRNKKDAVVFRHDTEDDPSPEILSSSRCPIENNYEDEIDTIVFSVEEAEIFGRIPKQFANALLRKISGKNLLHIFLKCVDNLRLQNGLTNILVQMGTAPTESCFSGYLNEVMRLGLLSQRPEYQDDPFVIRYDFGNFRHKKIKFDAYCEKTGKVLELKYASKGDLGESARSQAIRYAEVLSAGRINAVEYHITCPANDSRNGKLEESLAFLISTIPGVNIIIYNDLADIEGIRVDTNRYGKWEMRRNRLHFVSREKQALISMNAQEEREMHEAELDGVFEEFCGYYPNVDDNLTYDEHWEAMLVIPKGMRQMIKAFDGPERALDFLWAVYLLKDLEGLNEFLRRFYQAFGQEDTTNIPIIAARLIKLGHLIELHDFAQDPFDLGKPNGNDFQAIRANSRTGIVIEFIGRIGLKDYKARALECGRALKAGEVSEVEYHIISRQTIPQDVLNNIASFIPSVRIIHYTNMADINGSRIDPARLSAKGTGIEDGILKNVIKENLASCPATIRLKEIFDLRFGEPDFEKDAKKKALDLWEELTDFEEGLPVSEAIRILQSRLEEFDGESFDHVLNSHYLEEMRVTFETAIALISLTRKFLKLRSKYPDRAEKLANIFAKWRGIKLAAIIKAERSIEKELSHPERPKSEINTVAWDHFAGGRLLGVSLKGRTKLRQIYKNCRIPHFRSLIDEKIMPVLQKLISEECQEARELQKRLIELKPKILASDMAATRDLRELNKIISDAYDLLSK